MNKKKLKDYLETERLLKQLGEQLRELENSTELQQELEFKKQLEELMDTYGFGPQDVIEILCPNEAPAAAAAAPVRKRRTRKEKVYRNPHTNEEIAIRGGNHNIFKAWKKEYGADTVEGWLVEERA